MCGICGVIGVESQENAAAILRRMMSSMEHRGPDAEGSLVLQEVALGMKRLSIIDLAGGSQPVWNEDATLAAVFNGEIYNFAELREQLAAQGHRFATRSDTEVIVHAYESWGEDCVRRFLGMFAFAVLELDKNGTTARKVFLARDPLGIKPLYYSWTDGALLFASEIRALLGSRCVSPDLSAEAISAYLLFGSVSEPVSLLEGVFSLPPGRFMRICPTRPADRQTAQSYWPTEIFSGTSRGKDPKPRAGGTPAARVRTLLEQAVASHLVADVPVGVFLSSGLDSTALAALASRAQAGIHTFTVAFPDLKFSEAEIARRTAARLGTQHQELTISCEEMLARLDEAIGGFDQPSMDGINTYFVSWAARQAGLKVALSGLGSDELFGGYSTFQNSRTLRRVARTAQLFPKPARELTAKLAESSKLVGLTPDATQKALAAWRESCALPDEYFFTRLLFTPQKAKQAMRTLNRTESHSELWWQWLSAAVEQAKSMDDFAKVSWLESRSYLVNTLLRDTDAMSMHHSLEVRVPFLDLPLVHYVFSLSAEEKGWRKRPKWLLVEALQDVLPEEILAQSKRTFTFPWDNWLRGALRERVAKSLADWAPALAMHIDGEFALAIWKEFLEGRTSWSRPWSLFVLNEWVKRHIACGRVDDASQARATAARVA